MIDVMDRTEFYPDILRSASRDCKYSAGGTEGRRSIKGIKAVTRHRYIKESRITDGDLLAVRIDLRNNSKVKL